MGLLLLTRLGKAPTRETPPLLRRSSPVSAAMKATVELANHTAFRFAVTPDGAATALHCCPFHREMAALGPTTTTSCPMPLAGWSTPLTGCFTRGSTCVN